MIAASLLNISPLRAVTPPTTYPASDPDRPSTSKDARGNWHAPPGLQKGINTVWTEFDDWVQHNGTTILRTQSDLFAKGLPPDTTYDDIVSGVYCHYRNAPPPKDAYIKWQILSGLPHGVDLKHEVNLRAAYDTAPEPLPAYSTNPQARKLFDSALNRRTMKQKADLESGFEKLSSPIKKANAPILAFRTAILSHLPPDEYTFRLQVKDLTHRFQAGVAEQEDVDRLDAALQVLLGKPHAHTFELHALDDIIKSLADIKMPEMYTGKIVATADGTGIAWERGPTLFSWEQLAKWQDAIKQAKSKIQSN